MSIDTPTLLESAEFNPAVRKYWLLSGSLILFITVAGIPLLLFWWILGMYVTGRYLDRMACELTTQSLIVKKGILVRVEKTIPLDKITDLGLIQGPVMRYFGIHALSVETAGSTSQGALVKLHGIVDVEGFRDRVLKQKDLFLANENSAVPAAAQAPSESSEVVTLLREIRDELRKDRSPI